jgi:SNF2 family DNA or RNA helicase
MDLPKGLDYNKFRSEYKRLKGQTNQTTISNAWNTYKEKHNIKKSTPKKKSSPKTSPVKKVVKQSSPKKVAKKVEKKSSPKKPTKEEKGKEKVEKNSPVKKVEKNNPVKKAVEKKADPVKKVVEKKKKVVEKKASPIKKVVEKKNSPKREEKGKEKVLDKKSEKIITEEKESVKKKSSKCVERSKIPLKEYQEKLVEYLNDPKHKGIIAVWDVGSGKTLLAVSVSQCYLDAHPKGKVVVVTPVSLQENFKKEVRGYGANPSDPRYEFLTLQKFANEYSEKQCSADTLLILDEAHNLRTETEDSEDDTGRARIAINCAMKSAKVLLLTATPLYNNPNDILNLAAMARGEKEKTSDFLGSLMTDPDGFVQYFAGITSFYKRPASSDYPSVTFHNIEIPMTQEYYTKYFEVQRKNKKVNQDGSEKSLGAFLLGIRTASNTLGDSPKADWVLKNIKDGEKTLIYSFFLDSGLNILKKKLDGAGIKYAEITGKLSMKKRKEVVDSYNADKIKILFISKAGGEGLDLKGTRRVIIFESSWNRPNEEQVIGRASRYKSHSHLPQHEQGVKVYRLLMVKPQVLFPDDKTPLSADQMLQERMDMKEAANKLFLKIVAPISIENILNKSLKEVESEFRKVWAENIDKLREAMAQIAPSFKIGRSKKLKVDMKEIAAELKKVLDRINRVYAKFKSDQNKYGMYYRDVKHLYSIYNRVEKAFNKGKWTTANKRSYLILVSEVERLEKDIK